LILKGKNLNFKNPHPNWIKKGQRISKETEFTTEKQSGNKHFNWQGGKSLEIYGEDWTGELRVKVRLRDNYTCQSCGKKRSLDVHHIDSNKHNNSESNLILLCRSCHLKTHRKQKNYGKN
jgi:5-methylcytosine-specific restriction endonuclease McrA